MIRGASYENVRRHGALPFKVVVIHGGPGALGDMAPVARRLSCRWGVVEPLQSGISIDGQVHELEECIRLFADAPVTLIGHSWGAWLALIFAARHPSLVGKLILVGSGPLEPRYAQGIMETRLSRLSQEDRREVERLSKALSDPDSACPIEELAKFGRLLSQADDFDPVPHTGDLIAFRTDVYQGVWPEAEEMRETGRLFELVTSIECPVTAIHGDYDPHPYQGVFEPLTHALSNFRAVLLERCGHKPWIERAAQDLFYRVLEEEII